MSYAHAIFGGAVLMAAAIAFAATTGSRAAEDGSFEGVPSLRGAAPGATIGDTIWRINRQSGAVSVCFANNTREAPSCSPWTK